MGIRINFATELSTIRLNCFRFKSDKSGDEGIRAFLEPHLNAFFNWSNFGTEWDVYIDFDSVLHIVPVERDIEFAHRACITRSVHAQNNIPYKPSNTRIGYIIGTVERNMIGNMDWSTYGNVWEITPSLNTRLIGTSGQKEVSEEMIKESMRSHDDTPFVGGTPIVPIPVDFSQVEHLIGDLHIRESNEPSNN